MGKLISCLRRVKKPKIIGGKGSEYEVLEVIIGISLGRESILALYNFSDHPLFLSPPCSQLSFYPHTVLEIPPFAGESTLVLPSHFSRDPPFLFLSSPCSQLSFYPHTFLEIPPFAGESARSGDRRVNSPCSAKVHLHWATQGQGQM